MNISKKLSFLLCIVFICNVTAMDKQNLFIGENACYQMLRNQFHQPFDETKSKMQLGEYHGVVEETLKRSFKEILPQGQTLGKIEINQIELGVDNESSTIYNSMYRSQHKLHFFEIPIIGGQKTKHIYLIDVLPYEIMAILAEKFNNYERIKRIISNNQSLNDEQKSNIQSKFDQEFVSNRLEDDIIAQRGNLHREREAIKKEKMEVKEIQDTMASAFQEEIKKSQETSMSALQEEVRKIQEATSALEKAKQELQYEAQATFWNCNPKYTFGAGFLTCGLLGLYLYCQQNAGAFVADAMGFWRKN